MFSYFKENVKAGLTVATVSLPLSISLSIASGAGPTLGVITSIWAGFFASFFGSSNYNIVGVAGALTSLIAVYVLSFGTFAVNPQVMILTIPLLTLVTGGIIFFMYFFRLQKYFRYIPSSVMYGFAAGVASSIAATQIKDIVSILPPPSPHIPESLLYIVDHLSETNFLSVTIFFVAFLALFAWKKWIKGFPAVLPIAITGILFGFLGKGGEIWGMHVSGIASLQSMILLNDRFPNDIALLLQNPFSAVLQIPNVEVWKNFLSQGIYWKFVLESASIIALIAVLETVITAKLADKMTGKTTDDRKEILGLAMGTIASGCAGGLPPSGVFIRTGLNARSGAKGKMSGMLAALFTAFFAIIFLPFFQFLPMAVVAAMLFHTALGLLELEKAKEFWHYDKKNFFVYLLVAFTVFFHDASIGILLGSVVALLLFVEGFAEGQHSFLYDDGTHHICEGYGNHLKLPTNAEGVFMYSFEGLLVYLNTQYHEENIREALAHPKVNTVIFRFRHVFYIDLDGEEMLMNMIDTLEKAGKKVMFTSISKHVIATLQSHPTLKEYLSTHEIHKTTREMLTNLGYPKET